MIENGKWIFRWHRATLRESVETTIEFDSLDSLLEYVADEIKTTPDKLTHEYYCDENRQDILLTATQNTPNALLWLGPNDILCAKEMFGEDCMTQYGSPQAVGFVRFLKKDNRYGR